MWSHTHCYDVFRKFGFASCLQSHRSKTSKDTARHYVFLHLLPPVSPRSTLTILIFLSSFIVIFSSSINRIKMWCCAKQWKCPKSVSECKMVPINGPQQFKNEHFNIWNVTLLIKYYLTYLNVMSKITNTGFKFTIRVLLYARGEGLMTRHHVPDAQWVREVYDHLKDVLLLTHAAKHGKHTASKLTPTLW